MNAKPPTRLVVSGGKRATAHLVMVDDDRPTRRRDWLILATKAVAVAALVWLGITLTILLAQPPA